MKNTNECRFTASNFDRADFESLAESLAALGVVFDYEISQSGKTARVRASFPDRFEARRSRTRNAGRRSKGINPPNSSIFNRDTTCREFLDWQKSHSVEEGMEQLGLSRATYFRRLSAMRNAIHWEIDHNPERVKEGLPEKITTLREIR